NQALPPGRDTAAEVGDLDLDAAPEVVLRSGAFNLYVDPAEGGSVYEWDWRPRRFNLANVLTRRPEGYHQELIEAARQRGTRTGAAPPGADPKQTHAEGLRVKEARLEELLHYDWYRRASFLDHLLGPSTGLDAYSAARYPEVGDFVNQPYQFAVETLP